MEEGRLPKVEDKNVLSGKYFSLRTLAAKEFGFITSRKPCLARRATLKLSSSLKQSRFPGYS
jgi:hypothetical protein